VSGEGVPDGWTVGVVNETKGSVEGRGCKSCLGADGEGRDTKKIGLERV
jgi:hypothetical protein